MATDLPSSKLRRLRVLVVVLLALLFVQYEFGMAVNLSNPPSLAAMSVSDGNAVNAALQAAGGLAQPHAILGFVICLVALVNLVLAFRSGARRVQVFGALSFLAVSLAGYGGSAFVLSGFNNDSASHTMATNFLLAFTFAFLELYYLKA